MPFRRDQVDSARVHLQAADPTMCAIITAVGPFTAKTSRDRFLTLIKSLLSQQISVAAARTIQQRLAAAVASDGITAASLLQFDVNQLRAIGISRQKAGYMLDLSAKVESGEVLLSKLGRLTNAEVIAELTKVKGIGVWTAQMFLMFSLGRMDVFPAGDLGIQNAIRKNYPIRGQLTSAKMERIAKPWSPWLTIASWYLWQSLELPGKD